MRGPALFAFVARGQALNARTGLTQELVYEWESEPRTMDQSQSAPVFRLHLNHYS